MCVCVCVCVYIYKRCTVYGLIVAERFTSFYFAILYSFPRNKQIFCYVSDKGGIVFVCVCQRLFIQTFYILINIAMIHLHVTLQKY